MEGKTPEPVMDNELVDTEPVTNDKLVDSEPVTNDKLVDSEPVMHDEPVHIESVMNDEPVHTESVMNNELIHSEPVSNNELVHSEPDMNNVLVLTEPDMNNELVHIEPDMNNVLVLTEPLMDNELVVSEPIMNNELIPMDTLPMDSEMQPFDSEMQQIESDMQPIDSDMHLEISEAQPYDTEMQHMTPDTQPAKRRKKKSIVWEYFTIENVGAGCRRACCKQCKQSFAYSTGSKVAGTSHLKRHIDKGTCRFLLHNQEKNQTPYSAPSNIGTVTHTPKRRYHRTPSVPYITFDADQCRREISQMIIMHDYPLHMVEHSGFVAFVQNLQPKFDMVSFNTVQGDCVATYLREKQNIQKLIDQMHGRICLTLDLWSSSQTIGYMFLTAQFIDSDWKIHRKLLNVIMEPYPESDTAFSHSVAACLSDWTMDGKLFSVTINQPLSDPAIDNLRALLSAKNPLVLNGQLILGNCLARSLSGIVQDALFFARGVLKKVRDIVKYVKTSESREEKFLELKNQLQVSSSKNLTVDDLTQWNTTYEMLLAAVELREVFFALDISDPDFKNAMTEEDWKQVDTLCSYMKPLFDTANVLMKATTQTTNTFFHEAWKIHLELVRGASSEDPFVNTLAKTMQEKFDQYWKSSCFILAIAVVMDPRFKMKLVEFSFNKIYGEEAASYIKIVHEGIHELFLEYVSLPLPGVTVKSGDTQGIGIEISSNGLGLTDFDAYIMEATSQLSKSELDQYLEDSLLPRVHDFDVIGWWKVNRMKYPTLSNMALDILSIPVCSVPVESVFETERKEMDSYRCSLRPETVEALICAKDWLKMGKDVESSVPVMKMGTPI